MPSPFPGMDPYLEGELWPGFHHETAVEVKRQLVPQLGPEYGAFTEKYFLAESEDDLIIASQLYPDVGIAAESRKIKSRSKAALISAPVQVATVMPYPISHFRVVIRDLEKRRLVTVIEFLSPTNKTGDERKRYMMRRRRILASSVHLVEIDLLRKGQRVPWKGRLPSASYYVFLSRASNRPVMDVWPIVLDQLLPTIPIPLLPGDDDITLNLQQAFTAVYDLGGFRKFLRYKKLPEASVTREQSAWISQRLRAAGLR